MPWIYTRINAYRSGHVIYTVITLDTIHYFDLMFVYEFHDTAIVLLLYQRTVFILIVVCKVIKQYMYVYKKIANVIGKRISSW